MADFYAARAGTNAGAPLDGFLTAVHTAGLNPEEKIIVKGLVRPGMQVAPQMISMLPGQSSDGGLAAAEAQEARR